MIQFFRSNIECFEYLSHVPQMVKVPIAYGELYYYQWPGFHEVIEKYYKCFFYKSFWFTTSFSHS